MSTISSREEALFSDALARPAAERAAFLDEACGGDAALRARITALLAAYESSRWELPVVDRMAQNVARRRMERNPTMNPKLDSERVKEIFEHAIDLASSEERWRYVKGVCDGDAELQARVQTLLRVHFESEAGFLPESPRPLPITSSPSGEIEGKAGTVIGRYKLLQKIGEGGCGVVWMAEQEQPVRRRVALKVIKLGMDTHEFIARFEAERQALALMDHPNIARVFDAGATPTGRPYLVMELIRPPDNLRSTAG